MQISMGELLKHHRTSTPRSFKGLAIVIQGDSPKSKGKYKYLTFILGLDVTTQIGIKEREFLNFVYDTEKRSGFLEAATSTTGRYVSKYHKNSQKLIVRFPFIEGYGLPLPEKQTELISVKTRKGKVSFLYEGRIDELENG